jgi:hypothetical protein
LELAANNLDKVGFGVEVPFLRRHDFYMERREKKRGKRHRREIYRHELNESRPLVMLETGLKTTMQLENEVETEFCSDFIYFALKSFPKIFRIFIGNK